MPRPDPTLMPYGSIRPVSLLLSDSLVALQRAHHLPEHQVQEKINLLTDSCLMLREIVKKLWVER